MLLVASVEGVACSRPVGRGAEEESTADRVFAASWIPRKLEEVTDYEEHYDRLAGQHCFCCQTALVQGHLPFGVLRSNHGADCSLQSLLSMPSMSDLSVCIQHAYVPNRCC